MGDDTLYQFRRIYPTSDARSEPFSTFTSTRQIVSSSPHSPSPPLWTVPSSPVKIKQGLWRDGEDLLYSSDWPPVQQYLSETNRNRRLAPAPTEIVFALAALEVLHQPHNPVHWLFWGATYLSNVPWIGISEYKRVISAIQEKWEFVHVRKRWYPVDGQPETSTKRLLRSSTDRVDQTINSYFNLPEDGEPPLKRTRRAAKKLVETRGPITTDRTKQAKVEPKPLLPSTSTAASSIGPRVKEDSPPVTRASSRLKTMPSRRSSPPAPSPYPPGLSSPTELALTPEAPSILSSTALMTPASDISSTSSSHFRNRSTSQSSAETLVDSDEGVQLRSASVTSTDTVVGNPLSKKRKSDVVEESLELAIGEMAESSRREGMVTRGRASKFRLVKANIGEDMTIISRSNTPARESNMVTERPKPRAKRSRVKK